MDMANHNPAAANPHCSHSMKKMDKVLEWVVIRSKMGLRLLRDDMYAVVDVLQPGNSFKGDTNENLFPL